MLKQQVKVPISNLQNLSFSKLFNLINMHCLECITRYAVVFLNHKNMMRVKNMTISRKNTFRESLNIYETNFKHF